MSTVLAEQQCVKASCPDSSALSKDMGTQNKDRAPRVDPACETPSLSFFTIPDFPAIRLWLFSDFDNLKCAGIRFWPGVRLLRGRRNGIVFFRANQEDVMSFRIEGNRARAVNRFDIGDQADFVWRIGMENFGYAGLPVAAVAAGSKNVSR